MTMGKVRVSKKDLWQAIIKNCVNCVGGKYWSDIRFCEEKEGCPLWAYRPGGLLNPKSTQK